MPRAGPTILRRLGKSIDDAPNVPHDKAPVPLQVKGPRLHEEGKPGYR